jgi:hypothetical protein
LKPDVRDDAAGILKLVGPDINGAPTDARIAIQVGGAAGIRVEPRIDARRAGLQVQIAPRLVYEQGSFGEIADTIGWQRRGATIVHRDVGGIRTHRGAVVIDDAVIERAIESPTAISGGRVATQGAVVQRARIISPAAISGRVAIERAVVQDARKSPTAGESYIAA